MEVATHASRHSPVDPAWSPGLRLGRALETEEAIYHSLFMATTVASRSGTVAAIPLDRVKLILAKYRVDRVVK